MIKIKRELSDRICQGDIISEVPYIDRVIEKDGILTISRVIYPFVVVLTQDCDLEEDYRIRVENKSNQDKFLVSVLVAPLYNIDHVFMGEHLLDLKINSQPINRKATEGRYLLQNNRPRYHYLDFPPGVPLVPSVIDFKHYFSVSTLFLQDYKKSNYIISISELYREAVSQRFAAFLSRIGLPENINKE